MKKVALIVLGVMFCVISQAQVNNLHKWSFEVELIQPFVPTVHIWNVQATRNLFNNGSQSGDLLLGLYLRPNVEHDVVEEIDEYMFYAAYRHYFWKGLHLESGMNTGYYWGWNNLVDGKDYEGVGIYYEANVGYKLDFGENKRFFVNPQFGVMGTMGLSDIGPRQGKTDHFIQGNLLIGINF